MRYMGSKRRIARHILPIILADREPGQHYVEPFCGGCNLIDKVTGPRIANDAHPYLIALMRELQTQVPFAPPAIGEAAYKQMRKHKDVFPDWLVGYAGFNLSFGADFFAGYAKDSAGTDYEGPAVRSLNKQAPLLAGIEFHCGSYLDLPIPPRSIIYCDPPYKGTAGYKVGAFDHWTFYLWCHEQARLGHRVFISEYDMPAEWFRCVWEGEIASNLDAKRPDKRAVERLFVPI